MWVHFTADHDFRPQARKGRVTVAYKAGMVANVTRECGEQAIAAGRAVTMKRRDRDDGKADRSR